MYVSPEIAKVAATVRPLHFARVEVAEARAKEQAVIDRCKREGDARDALERNS
jgi:hypothetical protein